ncbi:hypothetical protein [Neorhizobium tomejilense]|uniref:hypothetical protein n=1 Tax=Neorhizobium tomejilense TaxID=2093828 RepID=UPI000CF983E3|nr:hypothetical protein [Neorhizobium tomejilense]
MKTKLFLIDAGTARGKTYAYVEHIAKSSEKFVIGTQLSDLSISVKSRLIDAGIPEIDILVISSKTHKNCRRSFGTAIKSGNPRIIIADQSVVMSQYAGAEDYHLFLDEAPKIDSAIRVKAADPLIHAALTSLFQDTISTNAAYLEIECTETVAYSIARIHREYRKKDEDAALTYAKRFIDLTYAILDTENTRVIFKADDFRHWQEGTIDETSRDRRKLVDKITFHPTLKAAALGKYKSATIACANATKMEFYDHWLPEAKFETHPLSANLRKDISEVKADKIKVHFISENHGSWYELSKLDGGYQRVVNHFADAYQKTFYDKELLFCLRKGKDGEAPFTFKLERPREEPYSQERPAIRLSSNARGLDEFKHIHCAAILSPINPTTPEFKFKRDCHDMSPEAFREARHLNQVYQFASRTSARDYDCVEELHIFVLDRELAEGLCDIFKCAPPVFFDIGVPELRIAKRKIAPKTGTERQNKYLENKRAIENDLSSTDQYEGFKVIQWAKRGADTLAQETMSWFELVQGLAAQANDYSPKSKTSSKVFREGDLKDLANHKLCGNIKSTKLVFLDIDNAMNDPKLLSDFFYKLGWSHFIYHSFSSTNNERHIRVVIGLDTAVNADNYTRIIKLIEADILAKFGTYKDEDGKDRSFFEIDQSKMTINCNFHNPCVPEEGSFPFIKRTAMETGQFKAKLLNVEHYLSRHQVAEPQSSSALIKTIAWQNTTPNVEEILIRNEVRRGTPGGHRNLFLVGQALLLEARLSFEEVQRLLLANIHRFGSPENRSVEGVMDSLRRYFSALIAAREAA